MNYDCVTLKRKILFKVYGPMQEIGEWRKRYNPRTVQALPVTGNYQNS